MVKLDMLGALFLVLQGAIFSGLLAINKLWENLGWPNYQLFGTAMGIVSIAVPAGLLITKTTRPKVNQLGPVIARSCFSGLRTLLQAVAAVTDAPLGDVAALTSINVVVATILGFLILGEKIRYFHIFGVGCSVIGAILVSQPSFLFGNNDSGSTAWLGYLLAVVSGCCQAGVFIAARKQKDVHPLFNSAGSHFIASMLCWILPYTPLVDTGSFSPVAANPVVIIGCVVLFAIASFISSAMLCAGSKWCAAALSATVDVCSRMICGYILQVLVFGQAPRMITLIGAALMFVSVAIMVSGRVDEPIPATSNPDAAGAHRLPEEHRVESGVDVRRQDADEDSDTESLVSFAASEFATKSPHMRAGSAPVRQRKGAAIDPDACTMGAAISVVAMNSL